MLLNLLNSLLLFFVEGAGGLWPEPKALRPLAPRAKPHTLSSKEVQVRREVGYRGACGPGQNFKLDPQCFPEPTRALALLSLTTETLNLQGVAESLTAHLTGIVKLRGLFGVFDQGN